MNFDEFATKAATEIVDRLVHGIGSVVVLPPDKRKSAIQYYKDLLVKIHDPDPKPPQHAFELTLKVGVNDWDMLIYELERLADLVKERGPTVNIASGMGYAFLDQRDVTEDQYRRELAEWREEMKRRRSK